MRKALDLCGTIATGLIFSRGGMLFLMSPHLTTLAYWFVTFSFVSWRRAVIAAGDRADRWGPRCIAAMICSRDQSWPALTGQPSVAQVCSMGAAEWPRAKERGNMVLPMLSFMGAWAGMDSSAARVAAMWASISGSVIAVRGDLKISMWMDAGVRLA